MPPLPHHLDDGDDALPGNGLHPHLHRFNVDDRIFGHVVEDRRNCRRKHDHRIVHSEELRHDEGGRAHDGGHDHPSRSGHGNHRRGEDRFEPRTGHEGDSEGARGRHVPHGAAVDHPHEAAGHDGDLGLAADGPARQGHGKVLDEAPHPRLGEKGSEEDEEEDVGGGDAERDAEDPLRGEKKLVDDPFEAEPRMAQHSGDILPPVAVGEEDQGEDHKLLSHGAPCGLEDADHEDGPHDVVHGDGRPPHAEGVEGEEDVEARREGEDKPQRIEHGGPFPRSSSAAGVEKEGQEQQEGEVDASLLHCHEGAEPRGVKMEEGHTHGDHCDEESPFSGEFAEPGFRIHLFKDLLGGFQCRGFGVYVLYRGIFRCHRSNLHNMQLGEEKNLLPRQMQDVSLFYFTIRLSGTATPFSWRYLIEPAWRGMVIPLRAFSITV